MTVTAVLLCLAAAGVILSWRTLALRSRRRFPAAYRLPDAIMKRFSATRAELNDGQRRLVQRGLAQYFRICQEAHGKFVSMPSQVVDDLWHEFILFTRNYERFCEKAFARYLHHTPVEAMSGAAQATEGIRRTWFHACRLEDINPKHPERLPLLFALDAQLGIADGFFYALHCDSTVTARRHPAGRRSAHQASAAAPTRAAGAQPHAAVTREDMAAGMAAARAEEMAVVEAETSVA